MALNPELQAIKDATDAEIGDGMDFEGARKLADKYVAKYPQKFEEIKDLPLEALVRAVDVLRAAGLEESQWNIETWLLHHFEPQNIGGTAQPQIRIPG